VFRKQRGFAWYHAVLPTVPGPHRVLQFEGVDDNATVFLNGKRLAYHKGWNDPFEVKLDSAWRMGGPNELLVLVENTDNTGGIAGGVALTSNNAAEGAPVLGWRERGGVPGAEEDRGWIPLADGARRDGPALYRTAFTCPARTSAGPVPILRLAPLGLSRGFVWLNGHNLGRYPEKTRAPGLYLPECWLKPGANQLVVFDEEGNAPAQVHIAVEHEASRLAYGLQPASQSR
jgi:beta-galactosidase